MAIKSIHVTVTGIDTLLQSNPQVVDPFNPHGIELSEAVKIARKSKTPENTQRVRELEIDSKIFWDDKLGIYAPTSWLIEAIASNAHGVAKLAKKKARGAVFSVENKAKLKYKGCETVKNRLDIVCNKDFHLIRVLPQGTVRVCKAIPMFRDWSFSTVIEYDDTILSERMLQSIITYAAKYGGFGDFRPTHGRASVEFA